MDGPSDRGAREPGAEPTPLAARVVARTLEDRVGAVSAEMEALLAAAASVVADSGSLDPPVRQILRAAGLSTKALYRHFRSKDELLLVLLDRGVRYLATYLRQRMDRADGPLEAIEAWIVGIARQAADHDAAGRTRPYVLDSMRLAERFPDEYLTMRDVLAGQVREQIEAANAAGIAHSPDPGRDAYVVLDYGLAFLDLRLALRTPPDEADVRHLVEFTQRAIGVRAGHLENEVVGIEHAGYSGRRDPAGTGRGAGATGTDRSA